jgi:hypothetical protein
MDWVVRKFNPTDVNEITDLYFVEFDKIIRYFGYDMLIRDIDIPDDAQIYIGKYYNKIDKIILKNKIIINELLEWSNYEFCKISVQQNGLALQFVKPEFITNEL